VLATGIDAGDAWIDPDSHPLAASVHRWTITNLILWPVLGKTPQHLHEFVPRTPRRGPAPSHPALTAEERTRFLDHLLTVAERAKQADEALLRRQAVYLLGFDGRPDAVDWLRTEWSRAGRTPSWRHDLPCSAGDLRHALNSPGYSIGSPPAAARHAPSVISSRESSTQCAPGVIADRPRREVTRYGGG
jgi:hypothetical protein